jgi:hypothetical protein
MSDVERRVSKLEATFLRPTLVDADEVPLIDHIVATLEGVHRRFTARGRPVPEDIIRLLDRALRILKAPDDLRTKLDQWLGVDRGQAAPTGRPL